MRLIALKLSSRLYVRDFCNYGERDGRVDTTSDLDVARKWETMDDLLVELRRQPRVACPSHLTPVWVTNNGWTEVRDV